VMKAECPSWKSYGVLHGVHAGEEAVHAAPLAALECLVTIRGNQVFFAT